MGKKAKSQASGERGEQQTRSDDEILKDRRLLEAFDAADSYLKFLGVGMWVLAVLWLFNFSEKAMAGSSLHQGANDVHLILVVMGFFCRWLAQASPRSWSGWRRAWHLGWCPILMLLALAMVSCLLQSEELLVAKMPCVYIAIGLAVVSLGSFATLPGPSLKPSKAANVPLCRCLIAMDGLVVLAFAVSVVMGAARDHGLGILTAAMTALPMLAWGSALILCATEAELLAALPTIVIFCVGVTARSLYLEAPFSALGAVIAILFHLLPYLPLPLSDSESNPFHMALRKSWRRVVRLMSQPVSGFGDDE